MLPLCVHGGAASPSFQHLQRIINSDFWISPFEALFSTQFQVDPLMLKMAMDQLLHIKAFVKEKLHITREK